VTQPIDPSVIIAYAEIVTKDAARCRSMTVLWPEHEHIDVRCTLPLGHTGEHDDGDGETWDD
jgi:hypothetical protein